MRCTPVRYILWWGGSHPYRGVLVWSEQLNRWHSPRDKQSSISLPVLFLGAVPAPLLLLSTSPDPFTIYIHAYKINTPQMHAHEMHAHETHAHKTHVHERGVRRITVPTRVSVRARREALTLRSSIPHLRSLGSPARAAGDRKR
jgi:hypothetical protein